MRTPKVCEFERANFRNLRWRNWGKRVATATGVAVAMHGTFNSAGKLVVERTRVKLVASQPLEYNGKRYYTKLKATSKYTRKYGGGSAIQLDPPPGF